MRSGRLSTLRCALCHSEIELVGSEAKRIGDLLPRRLAQALASFLLRVGRLADAEATRDFGLRQAEVLAPRARRRLAVDHAAHDRMRHHVACHAAPGNVIGVGNHDEGGLSVRPVDQLNVNRCVHRAFSLPQCRQP
ncbi:protein of unknown function [Burkholderia multivorans]